MRLRPTLSRKILCVALLNIALLALALLALARAQFGFGPESLLLGPAHDRIRGIADAFTAELEGTPDRGRDALVESYRKRYGADFFLVGGRGQQIAGPSFEVREELLNEVRRLLPPPGGRGGASGRGGPPGFGPRGRRGELEAPPPEGPEMAGGLDGRVRPHQRRDPPVGGGEIGGPPQEEKELAERFPAGTPPRPRRDGRSGVGDPPPYRTAQDGHDGTEGNGRLPSVEEEAQLPPAPRLPPESVFLRIAHNPTRYWAGARIRSTTLSGVPGGIAILLIRSNSLLASSLFFNWRLWLGVALTVIGLSVICWLPFIRGLTRSIAHMDRVTQQIAEGRFDVQAAAPRSDELGHLGQQIDRMAARLESFVQDQKRFLGDIAHELCAPIARIQFALGILEQKAGEGEQRHVAALHEEIQEMSTLVNELLSFAKAGMQAGSAPLAVVSVTALVEKTVAREGFAGRSIELRVDPGIHAMANEALLSRALGNVVRNAIRYAGAAGPIVISAERDGGKVAVTVADNGPGLPESELEKVFEPFYRPEAARTRETGGAGLGLAIVRTCVETCGGTVSCRNRKPGLEIEMKLIGA
jgi:two-component system sensor histidine kinase CpxA